MKPVVFLSLHEVIQIHRVQIRRYGGLHGLRDLALLQSAIAMPESGSGKRYFHETVYEMAAAYMFHIIRNHPFIDGNKRTGAVAAIVFLALNGIEINAPEGEFERLVRAVASGKSDKKDIAEFFRTATES
jgi:death-on-curing protein